jgi:hypothetical protein
MLESVAAGDVFLLNEHGLISVTVYWRTLIQIPFTQLNVTTIGLGFYYT